MFSHPKVRAAQLVSMRCTCAHKTCYALYDALVLLVQDYTPVCTTELGYMQKILVRFLLTPRLVRSGADHTLLAARV